MGHRVSGAALSKTALVKLSAAIVSRRSFNSSLQPRSAQSGRGSLGDGV